VPEVIAEEHAGQVDVVKLNVDENPAPAQEYGIMLVPTLAVFPPARSSGEWSGRGPSTP